MLINGFEFQMSLNWSKMRAEDVRPSSSQLKSFLDPFLLLHEFEMEHIAVMRVLLKRLLGLSSVEATWFNPKHFICFSFH